MEASSVSEIVLDISNCEINNVTVYKDRAEVVRSFTIDSPSFGENRIRVKSVTRNADGESIRVKGMGTCQILEVSHDSDLCVHNESEKSALKTEIRDMQKEIDNITKQIERIKKKRILTQTYADGALCRGPASSVSHVALSAAVDILDYHTTQMEALDNLEDELTEKLSEKKDEMKLKQVELRNIDYSNDAIQNGFIETKTITILANVLSTSTNSNTATNEEKKDVIDAANEGSAAPSPITIQFSYVVFGTTWSPSYDLRVTAQGNKSASMDIHYFAEVTQKTGEDWMNCTLHLSTSNPAIGAAPPPLPSKSASWTYPSMNNIRNEYSKSGMSKKKVVKSSSRYDEERDDSFRVRANSMDLLTHNQSDYLSMDDTGYGDGGGGGASKLDRAAIAGSGDAGSTSFTIQRKVTIASDGKPHKVTVTVQTIQPQTIHYVVPSVSVFVYLQAKAVNTSPYPLLASNKVNVFLDGNFISTTTLRQASSGETFNVFLGVDPAIKVDYMPCRMTARNKGWLGGTEEKKYSFSTLIQNTKQQTCKILVVDALPRSSDEKIVVELLEPPVSSLSKPTNDGIVSSAENVVSNLDAFTTGGNTSDFVTHNKHTSNIVWCKTIRSGEKVEINFDYRVTWPSGTYTVDVN